jgi:short subunit dehydrogenase-like uncharacterized protein
MNNILIYGAYGYTGRLIVDQLLAMGIRPIVAGRDAAKTKAHADEKGLEHMVLDINDAKSLVDFLSKGKVVIHCAGPFIHTAKQMISACLETGTHYLDITGEYQVFDLAQSFDQQAKDKGIMLLPGAGFDVVPSDCLAAHLAAQMPNATDLILSFVNKGGSLSRGTTKTMIENLGQPTMYRKNGEYVPSKMGALTRLVDYGDFEQMSMAISWGDISSAHFSTGIPNIKVFAGTHPKQINKVRQMNSLGFLFRLGFVKNFLKKQIDKKPAGPNEEKREKSKTYMWGQVSNGTETKEARLVVPNGYSLTAETAAKIAQHVVEGNFKTGYQTPSTAYGKEFILEMKDCALLG